MTQKNSSVETSPEKKKHIFFTLSSMHGGGAERVASLLCNHWVDAGYQVTLVPTYSGRGVCVYPLDSRIKLDYLADHVSVQKFPVIGRMAWLLTLRQMINKDKTGCCCFISLFQG